MSGKKGSYIPYTGKKKDTLDSTDRNSLLFWGMGGLILVLLIWAPFQKALFNGNSSTFEGPIYTTLIWSSLLLLLTAIAFFYKFSFRYWSSISLLAVWLIPLSYVLSKINAASSYSSGNMILIQCIYASFFLAGYFLLKYRHGLKVLVHILASTSYLIVLFGIMNWFGHKETAYSLVKWFASEMPAMPFYQDVIMSDGNGTRLTSVFQYGNAYGAFLIAVLLMGLYLTTVSKKYVTTIYHGIMLVPIFVSFILTLSRGALVVFPVVYLIVILLMKPGKQILMLIYSALVTAVSLIVLTPITDIGVTQWSSFSHELANRGWLYLISASVALTLLIVFVQRFVKPILEDNVTRLDQQRFARAYFPLGVALLGVISIFLLFGNSGLLNIFPENIKQRIENINFAQNSVLERGTFYKDSIKLSSDYPIIGAGGGAWSALYEKYQNNPYVSRQAHNFFLQYLVEVGWLGLVIFIAFLGFILYCFVRYFIRNEDMEPLRLVFFIFTVSLLIHSILDFDLSFVYLGIVLFLSLGAMASVEWSEVKSNFAERAAKMKWVAPSLFAVISLVLFFNAIQLVNASRNYLEATSLLKSGSTDFNQIVTPLNQALDKHPNHPEYVLQKVAILFQVYAQSKDENYYKEAVSLIDQAREKEPFDYFLIERKIQSYLLKDNQQEALNLANEQIDNFPWKVALYERAIDLATRLGAQAFEKRDQQSQEQYWSKAIELYHRFESQKQALASLPKEQLQGNEFSLTPQMGFSLGQIYYLQKKYPESENMLRIGVSDNLADAFTRQNTRWYLAALQKQGKNDQAVYDKLVAADPNEKNEVQFLVNLK